MEGGEASSAVFLGGGHHALSSSLDGRFTWTVRNFSFFKQKLKTQKLVSPTFSDCNLCMSLFETNVNGIDYLSMCLESKKESMCLESKKESKKESCWCLFRMSVKTQKPGGLKKNTNMVRDSYGRLAIDSKSGDNASLGWNDYMKMADFIGPDLGFLVNDTAVFQASFQILKESSDFTKNVGRSLGERSMGTEKKSDEYIGKFTWRIDDFTRLRDLCRKRGLYDLSVKSKRFQIGDRDCRLIVYLYPGGSQMPHYLSLCLEVTDSRNTASDCSCFVSHRLSVVNQWREDKTIVKESQNRYSKAEKAWGWVNFMTFNSLLEKGAGFLVDGGVVFSAEVLILKETSEFSDLVEEFKFNPNAKSFIPLQTPLRSLTPVSDGSACLPMGVGIGTSFAGPQPVMYNPQAAPIQLSQALIHPNAQLYGQPMLMGHYPVQGLCTPGYMVWLAEDYEPSSQLNNKLIEKEAAMDSLVKRSENSLRDEQEASTEQINHLKGDILVFSTQLNAANSTITGLRNQLKTVERLVEEHKVEIQNLQSELAKTREDKNMIEATLKEKLDSIEVLQETVRLLKVEVKDKENDLRNLQSLLADKKLEYERLSSRSEASNLSEELAQSIRSCEELALDVSRIQAEFEEAQESFKKSMEKERSKSEILSNEIGSAKKVLQKTREEFRVVSDDLEATIATRNSLKKELNDVYKKVDKAANALDAERSTDAALRKELEASLKQISSDKEARQSLETDLEATTKALDEVNRNVVILSEELDMDNSRALQAEKEMLFDSLTQQRHLTNEGRENIEDGKEKESLEKKAN